MAGQEVRPHAESEPVDRKHCAIARTHPGIPPQAKAVEIAQCDHNGQDLSGPEKVAAAIRA